MNVFIIGITGVGKSLLGKKLARALHINFVDLDAYAQIIEQKSIIEMFDISQEYFRDVEHKALLSIVKYDNHVISTGGGIVLNPDNVECMRKNGIVIQLHRPIGDIVKKINISKRPLLKDSQTLYKIYEDRRAFYESARHILIDCTLKEEALKEMIRVVREYRSDNEDKDN